MIYKMLNNETKKWWYHKELRQKNQCKLARDLERLSIKNTVNSLRKVLKFGGYLSLGRKQWRLTINEHLSTSGLGTTSVYISGYYDINNLCYLESICKALDIPILDSRAITENEVFEFLKISMIPKNATKQELKNYVDNVKKLFNTYKTINI